MAKVTSKEARHTQRRDRASGSLGSQLKCFGPFEGNGRCELKIFEGWNGKALEKLSVN